LLLREYLTWKNQLFKNKVLSKNNDENTNLSRLFLNAKNFGGNNGLLDYEKLKSEDVAGDTQ